ncbi:MAG: LEA type 2 family protein [Flavobacteriales bacterium]|nr:LEA type 2 family protein [Flavobacteriales bacterium]NUQ14568.1 LEA type 2 family protein [Flavobacteriales bacterium]
MSPLPHPLRMVAALPALGLCVLLAGCLSYREVTVEGVEALRLTGLDARGLAVRAEVRVNNPNGYRIRLRDPDLELFLDGTRVGTAVLDTPLTVPARATSVVRVPLHARLEGGPLLATGLGMLLGRTPVLRAEGTVHVRAGWVGRRIPFRLEAPLRE